MKPHCSRAIDSSTSWMAHVSSLFAIRKLLFLVKASLIIQSRVLCIGLKVPAIT